MHFKNILVTTDFSDDSLRAFEIAGHEAKMQGSKIALLAVINDWDVPPVFMQDIANPEAITQYRKDLLQKSKEKLASYKDEYFHGQDVEVHALLSTEPAGSVITNFAKENDSNLIVIASHGRGAVGNLLLGSVVQKVIRHASCPVMVIPKKD